MTRDELTNIKPEQVLWNDKYCIDEEPLRQYIAEIKTAIVENNVKLLNKDYQTDEIKVQIEYLHKLVNRQNGKTDDSQDKQVFSTDLTFDIKKANYYLLGQTTAKSLTPAEKKKNLIKAKDHIKNLMVNSAKIRLTNNDRYKLARFVIRLLEAYLGFEATNGIKVSLKG